LTTIVAGASGVGAEPRVEPQVADDEVDAPVAREVAGDDAVPPAVAALEPRHGEAREPPAAGVAEDGDRHPLADHDEVRAAVAVHVAPHGVGDHPHARQLGARRSVASVKRPRPSLRSSVLRAGSP
jgi:hypothetical protein